MADRKTIQLPTRKLTVELNIKLPGQSIGPRGSGRETFDRAVADAVRRELQRTRRI